MFAKVRHNVRQPLVSLAGALAASTLVLALAASPARAGDRDADQWMRVVSERLQGEVREVPAAPAAVRMRAAAIVGVHFGADGEAFATSLDTPTGNRSLDDEALRAVNRVAFPALPASLRGRARIVPVELFFTTPELARDRAGVRVQAKDLAARVRPRAADVPAGRPLG